MVVFFMSTIYYLSTLYKQNVSKRTRKCTSIMVSTLTSITLTNRIEIEKKLNKKKSNKKEKRIYF